MFTERVISPFKSLRPVISTPVVSTPEKGGLTVEAKVTFVSVVNAPAGTVSFVPSEG